MDFRIQIHVQKTTKSLLVINIHFNEKNQQLYIILHLLDMISNFILFKYSANARTNQLRKKIVIIDNNNFVIIKYCFYALIFD